MPASIYEVRLSASELKLLMELQWASPKVGNSVRKAGWAVDMSGAFLVRWTRWVRRKLPMRVIKSAPSAPSATPGSLPVLPPASSPSRSPHLL